MSVSKLDTSDSGNLSGSGSIPTLGAAAAGASAGAKKGYVVENLHVFTLAGDGDVVVRKSIKPNCRDQIRTLKRANKNVVLATGATRAETLSETKSYSLQGNIGGEFKVKIGNEKKAATFQVDTGEKQGGGFTHAKTLTRKNVYLSVKLDRFQQ
ncbi:hypothetical protein C1M53_26570 [Mesorhizobium sp. Pch-S]|nr:hypothetical protein C1M53_26570 [Mesorhizobium sp. Pch-S]